MSLIKYEIGRASIIDIKNHLDTCKYLFNPPLDSFVDISEYSKKIRDNAKTIEAWNGDNLIGLIACYLNNENDSEGYITNVSVAQSHQKLGIASKLLDLTIKEALDSHFKKLSLEVEINNIGAISLYKKKGFVLSGRLANKYLMLNRLTDNKNIMVSICCVTYNHEKYIKDTLDSFITQKTNFSFEVLIHDDASTDQTANIIKDYENKYPDVIKPIYQKKNQYSQGRGISINYQFPRAKGKYIALCEGDDYWSDPYKLQKQVDFLEANPDYVMVHTDCDIFYEKDNTLTRNYNSSTDSDINEGYIFDNLLLRNEIMTCTVCARADLIKKYSKEIALVSKENNWKMGDYPLWLEIAQKDKIGYIKDSTAVYRVNIESASKSRNKIKNYQFSKSGYDIKYYFINKYGCTKETLNKVNYNFYQLKLDEGFNLQKKTIAKEYYSKLDKLQLKTQDKLKLIGSNNLFLWKISTYLIKFCNLCNKIRYKIKP